MKVELLALTKPLIPGIETAEEFIAYCARISNPGNQMNKETSPKLLRYLAKHKHWSPFEMVNMVLGITTTREIAHQIVRHRSFSFQEFSQRYAEVVADPVFHEARLQDPKNRQSSMVCENEGLQAWWYDQQEYVAKAAYETYEKAINLGIAKEVARSVLPEGMTETTVYMQGTVRSWIHYCELRASNGTQSEHAQIAVAAKDILFTEFPSLADILA